MKRVTVYTSNGCPWCERAKKYLLLKGVRYREINVSKRPGEAAKLMKKTGERGVPQIMIGEDFVVGFNQKRIDELLK